MVLKSFSLCFFAGNFQEKWLKSTTLIKSRKVAPLAKKKEKNESVRPANYTLYNQKITFEFLKAHLWSAADILRGSLDPADYRQPVMTLLFLKRLNDTFEENAEKLIKDGKSEREAYHNKIKGSKSFGQFGRTQRRNQENLFL